MEEEEIKEMLRAGQVGDFVDRIEEFEKRLGQLEGLDLSKYLVDKGELPIDEVVDTRIANLLQICHSIRDLNEYKRDAIISYLAKKAGISKTNLMKVIATFEKYLEELL